jgi:hypothetical protein
MPDLVPAPPLEVPPGKMRMWDPVAKKIILVDEPPGPDTLTLTVRLHDPKERLDPKKAAVWHTVKIPRADLDLSEADFLAKHLTEAVPVILGPHKNG